MAEWVTEEVLEARGAKVAERDAAVERILAHGRPTLKEALGATPEGETLEQGTHVRRLLRLLHPDYSLNLALRGKPLRRTLRAFKRLNGLWTSAQEEPSVLTKASGSSKNAQQDQQQAASKKARARRGRTGKA